MSDDGLYQNNDELAADLREQYDLESTARESEEGW